MYSAQRKSNVITADKQTVTIDALREIFALLKLGAISLSWAAFRDTKNLPIGSTASVTLRVFLVEDIFGSPKLRWTHDNVLIFPICVSALSVHELKKFDYRDADVIRSYASKHQFLCHASCAFQLHTFRHACKHLGVTYSLFERLTHPQRLTRRL